MASHAEPAYSDEPGPPLPVTERLSSSSLILPLFHDLTESEQDLIVSVIRAAAGQHGAEQASSAAFSPVRLGAEVP